MSESPVTPTRAQRYYADFMVDVLVYTVVLNLFVEYVDAIVIDSFTVSLLTAVAMKLLIDLMQNLIDRVTAYFGDKRGAASTVLRAILTWAILFASKIVILEVIAVIFEEDVDLGSFLDVLILVAVMMLARRLSIIVYLRLGRPGSPSAERTLLGGSA
jgi:hypothetical protein